MPIEASNRNGYVSFGQRRINLSGRALQHGIQVRDAQLIQVTLADHAAVWTVDQVADAGAQALSLRGGQRAMAGVRAQHVEVSARGEADVLPMVLSPGMYGEVDARHSPLRITPSDRPAGDRRT